MYSPDVLDDMRRRSDAIIENSLYETACCGVPLELETMEFLNSTTTRPVTCVGCGDSLAAVAQTLPDWANVWEPRIILDVA